MKKTEFKFNGITFAVPLKGETLEATPKGNGVMITFKGLDGTEYFRPIMNTKGKSAKQTADMFNKMVKDAR